MMSFNPNPLIVFHSATERVSSEDLRAFEERIGCSLPDDYFRFLEECGGGCTFEPSTGPDEDALLMFRVPDFDGRGEYSFDINHFYSLCPPRYGLSEVYQTMMLEWKIPACLLPVACTAGNLKIFLGLVGQERGKVLLGGRAVAEKTSAGQPVLAKDFIPIAASFTYFLGQLRWEQIK